MRTITVLLILFILLGFVNRAASDGLKGKDFNQYKDLEMFKTYIGGVGAGYFWANIALKESEQKSLYCPPEKLAVTGDNYLRILGDRIKEARQKGGDIEDTPVELILLFGLKEAFPCKK